MTLLKSESPVVIVALHQVRRYPMPVAEVKATDKTFWVPMAYLPGKASADVSWFPTLELDYFDPFPSMETSLQGVDDTAQVPVAKDSSALRAYIKAFLANDLKGKEELRLAGRVFMVEHGTPILVREVHPDAAAKDNEGVEIRVLQGPRKDSPGWVAIGSVKLNKVKGISVSSFTMRRDSSGKSVK
jgi:hypothetical protein